MPQRQNTSTAREKVEIPDNIEGLSVKEIKTLLDKLGVNRNDCFEKEDLVKKLKEAKGSKPPKSSKPTDHANFTN